MDFVQKRNEKNEIQRYKARLVAQGFSQRPAVDYEETYSPIMDAMTLRYLISFTLHEQLQMNLMMWLQPTFMDNLIMRYT